MKEFQDKISTIFKETRLAVDGDKPDLDDWVDLLEDDKEFGYMNPDVVEADEQFDPVSFDGYLDMELAIDRGGEYPEFARVT
mmetsp:Transcript_4573/g.7102  ORF Transcript_4573/g.7102 Transcript_4573/m.7102 type:complete len:82 (-) Transcript_4573:2530-2775(-)